MPYIGRGITTGDFTVITLTESFNGSRVAFTMSESVGNVNQLLVILSGVLQHWTDAFTISGTTLTFSSAPAASETIKILKLGDVVNIGTPSASSVSATQIASTLDLSSKTVTLPAASVTAHVTSYDDNKLQSNIALLGFKTAVNGSLAKYNLQDQIIDEYTDATGVDASASTNEILTAGVYQGAISTTPTVTHDADTTAVDGLYTVYKWTGTGAGSYVNASTQNHEWLVVAGGGAGGNGLSSSGMSGGGAGAGGFRAGASLSLTGGVTYTPTVGLAGVAIIGDATTPGGNGGNSILSGTGITTITSTGGGGGGSRSGTASAENGATGGSGGGAGYLATGGSATSITPITGETTTIQGRAGANGDAQGSASGGGHGAAGTRNSGVADGDIGGVGTSNSITGSAVFYAGGGAGGSSDGSTVQAAGGNGGGGAGGGSDVDNATVGTANTGGGGGGGGKHENGKNGGTGIVILRRLTLATSVNNLTLQSTDTTASTANPDYADMVMLMENTAGTATLNTDIKGYISEDSGVTFTQGTLVDEGTWGTNKKILAFHDLDISAQTGSAMCYKITTHNQSAAKETKIHATSIGWR